MKKITFSALLLLACFAGNAQFSFEAVDDYGRLEGVTYDLETQNKVYAVSLNNHIVVSYDNGQTWDLLFAFPDTGGRITNLRVLPGNENLCFSILNLDAQNGIYIHNIEDNEIINFLPLPHPEENPSINNFDVYDSDATTIVLNVSTDVGYKVYYTSTGGESWNEVYASADYNDVAISTAAISPDNPAKLVLTRGGGPGDVDGGVFISTDSGETWTETLPGVILNPIAFNPEDANDIIVGSDMFDDDPENIYRSADGGETWNIVPIEWNDFILDNTIVVKFHPVEPDVIYVLEENEIAYTEDGGETWYNTAYPEEEYYYGLSLTINPFDTKEVIITTNDYPKRSTDGGETLTQVKAPFCRVDNVSAVKFGDTEHLYYAAQGGHLHKNYTTGMTDAYNIEPPTTFSPTNHQMIADPLVEGRLFLYAGGFMGTSLYVSNDHGATRTQIYGDFAPTFAALATDPENTSIIYVALDNWGSSSLIKLDISDIDNVTSETLTVPGEGYTGGILVLASETENHLIVTKGSAVYKSVDGGANWDELYNAGAETLIWGLDKNPFNEDHFAIATSAGVYTSTDAGETWTATLEGIDARKVKFSDADNGVIAVGVFNSEGTQDAYIAYYNGTDWINVTSEELNYLHSYAMDFTFAEDTINAYVGSVDMGVMLYSFEVGELGIETPSHTPNSLVIAPNPASDYISVHASGSTLIKSVAVYSITGQKVAQSAGAGMSVAHLAGGMYIVKAETADGKTVSGKLIRK